MHPRMRPQQVSASNYVSLAPMRRWRFLSWAKARLRQLSLRCGKASKYARSAAAYCSDNRTCQRRERGHSGRGRSCSLRESPGLTVPSCNTRQYQPVRPFTRIRCTMSGTSKRQLSLLHGCRPWDTWIRASPTLNTSARHISVSQAPRDEKFSPNPPQRNIDSWCGNSRRHQA